MTICVPPTYLAVPVLDISMNPDSLFVDYGGKRAKNASARLLDVDRDMLPGEARTSHFCDVLHKPQVPPHL